MKKLIILVGSLFITTSIFAQEEMTEMQDIILNGKIAICYTGNLTTMKGSYLKVKKNRGVVRYGNKCIAKSKIVQADDYNVPYYEDILEKLDNKIEKSIEKIESYRNKITKEYKRDNPNEGRVSSYNRVIDDYSDKINEIKKEITDIKSEYAKYKQKLYKAQTKLKEMLKITDLQTPEEMVN